MKNLIKKKFDLLETQTNCLLNEIMLISEAKTKQPEGEGKWSIIQVLNHLIDAENSSLEYMQKKILGMDTLQKVGFSGSFRMYLFKLSQLSSRRFKAPDYVSQPSNTETLSQIIEKWRMVRNQLMKFIDQYSDELQNKGIMKHPFAGRITMTHTIDFFRYHMIHHRLQIGRIKKTIGK